VKPASESAKLKMDACQSGIDRHLLRRRYCLRYSNTNPACFRAIAIDSTELLSAALC
jgi:hypothetical protein